MTSEIDSPDGIIGIGAVRRKILEAIERKEKLTPIEESEKIEDLVTAVAEIELSWDDFVYMRPQKTVIDTMENTHDQLPGEAQTAFVSDETLIRRINAARRQFNDWLGRLKREREMPSPVEAGPANYPADKARRKSELQHEAHDELKDKIDGIRAGVNGARQRALNEIGSSIAEQNEQDREDRRERMRSRLEEGSIVEYRSPRKHIGCVVRVNKKSVRVRRPNPRAGQTKPLSDEQEPDYIGGRIQLDSNHLTILDQSGIANRDELPDSLPNAREHLLGE